MSGEIDGALGPVFTAALRTPGLVIVLASDTLVLNRESGDLEARHVLELYPPGVRSKRTRLAPPLIGAGGESHADMLRMLADALDLVSK